MLNAAFPLSYISGQSGTALIGANSPKTRPGSSVPSFLWRAGCILGLLLLLLTGCGGEGPDGGSELTKCYPLEFVAGDTCGTGPLWLGQGTVIRYYVSGYKVENVYFDLKDDHGVIVRPYEVNGYYKQAYIKNEGWHHVEITRKTNAEVQGNLYIVMAK